MELKTYIPYQKLIDIALAEGCRITEKTTCTLVERGTSPNGLYIAKTKDVHRININRFHCPDPSIARVPRGGPVGTFVQEVRFDLPEKQVLENWRTLCRNLDSYPFDPKKERQRPASFRRKSSEPVKGPSVEIKGQESVAEHAERLIAEFYAKRDLAGKMGFPLSSKTVADYSSKVAALGFRLEA